MARCEFIDDLIPLILEANDNWWPRNLASLSTVSSTWLFYTRKRLYPSPTIHSFPAATLLARSLAENPQLTSLVKRIHLRPVMPEMSSRRPQPQELRSLRFLLGIEGLQHITLGGELSVKAERFLRLISNPDTLQELHIDGSSLCSRLSARPSLEWDESLAFGFPNLNKLRLAEVELDIIPPSMPFPSPITNLTLENVHIISGHLVHLLGDCQVLERLHVTTSDPVASEEQLRLVLASCTVGCLHYESQKDNTSDRFVLDINPASAASLRCLHLKGLFVDLGVLNVVNEMYRNIVELVISGRAVRVSPGEWARFIRSGAFSSVRRLGLPWGTNHPPFLVWRRGDIEEIENACSSRKIPISLC
ncbi:hypothetical protein GALMADRAFT_218272 [Galerina marginata CBS 339.88]|uniref:F-box domain-containing protein n=1 Tax=Galerina marginata (strain CBS 339.88) TaxID=685588 RepID=A0A067TPP7_GALM3|nr:hypothetical protein GALMADRAFT_218272 [Galerina marginata CBS 339.88]